MNNSKNWRKRQNVISVNRMISASHGATIASTVVWKVYQNALGMRVGEQQKLKEFDLSSPQVQAKLKERYGKNIPLEETVVSPQAVFDAPQLTTVAKEWPLFSW